MLTIVLSLSKISSSDILLRFCVVLLLAGVVGVEEFVTDEVVISEGTAEGSGTVVFLFLSKIGENGTVPFAVLVIVSGVCSSTGFVYCNHAIHYIMVNLHVQSVAYPGYRQGNGFSVMKDRK